MKRFAFFAGLLLCGGTCAATQAQSPDSLKACARLSNEAERLACYDAAIAASDSVIAAEIAARKREAMLREAEAKRAAEAKAAQTKVDSFGANNLPPSRQPEKMSDTPDKLTAKIESLSYNQLGYLSVRLDNGQSWSQTESYSLPKIIVGDEVEIKRGALGSYRMRLLRANRVIRVLRKR